MQVDELWKLFCSPVNSKGMSNISMALDAVSHWGRTQNTTGNFTGTFIFSFKEWKLLLQGRYFLYNV